MTTFFTYFNSGFDSSVMQEIEAKLYDEFDVVDKFIFEGFPVFAIQSEEVNEMVFAGTFRDLVNSVGNNNGIVYLTPIDLNREQNLSWLASNKTAMKVREFLLLSE